MLLGFSLDGVSCTAYHRLAGSEPAVVIQELVPAEAAGILFTANPLTGKRDQVMINAAWGLGEAIVSGQVTADTTLIEKASSMPKHVQISEKHVDSSALCVIQIVIE